MRRFVFVVLLGLAGSALAQDAVQAVLQAAPQLVSFAGSPANFRSLVFGLTQGRPVRLVEQDVAGFSRVTVLTPSVALPAPQVMAVLERARQDLASLGVARPSPAQLSIALVGGILDIPTGRTELSGVLTQRGLRPQVRVQLEPDGRRPSADEQAFARLPADVQSLLSGLPATEALQKVELARQHLIALSISDPSPEQRRALLQRVLNPGYASVESASAGATTFPLLSPLVAPPLSGSFR